MLRHLGLSAALPAVLVAAVPAVLLGASPARASAYVAPGLPSPPASYEVIALTNSQRQQHGCAPLAINHDLGVAAARQSSYMARTGLFTHVWRDGTTFVARVHEAGYEQPSGENIAWGYEDVQDVMSAWMASPGHRRNILNCSARSIGTGVVYGANGVPYYTQEFGY